MVEKFLVGGEWRAGTGETFESNNPADLVATRNFAGDPWGGHRARMA